MDIEANATEQKKDLKNFLLDSVKEVTVSNDSLLTVKPFNAVKKRYSRHPPLRLPQDFRQSRQICDHGIRKEIQNLGLLHPQENHPTQIQLSSKCLKETQKLHFDLCLRCLIRRFARPCSYHRKEN